MELTSSELWQWRERGLGGQWTTNGEYDDNADDGYDDAIDDNDDDNDDYKIFIFIGYTKHP